MSSAPASAFGTIPTTNILGLFEHGEVDVTKTRNFLKFKKEDVARASGVNVGSVRFDDRVPPLVVERMSEIAVICELVAAHFHDAAKAALWFSVRNPLLGNISPRDMIRLGRFKAVHSIVMSALRGIG